MGLSTSSQGAQGLCHSGYALPLPGVIVTIDWCAFHRTVVGGRRKFYIKDHIARQQVGSEKAAA